MIEKLIEKLKTDKDFYLTWQSNIAMAFYDEYRRCDKKYKNNKDIHHIANVAADKFLYSLIKD